MDYKLKYFKYKNKYLTLKKQIGGNELIRFNASPVPAGRTFYIYTTGSAYNKSFERWITYIRDSIIDNILIDYDRIIIYHSDILFGEDQEDRNIEAMFSYERFVQDDIKHPKVYSSTFTYLSIPFQELHTRHGERDYILLDCAHVIKYILPEEGQQYDNLVCLQLYGQHYPSRPFHLNSVYFGVFGDEGDRYNNIIMTQRLFKVIEGRVNTYIKTLFDNHHYLFTRNELYINLPQLVYEPMLARCKKTLEAEWRTRYGRLFEKVQHPHYGLVDFDGVYYPYINGEMSPITLILNLYLEDEILNEDTVFTVVMDNMMAVFYPH
jgi:hypothetical protein